LGRWRKHFSQLFNVHGVNDDRKREIHTVKPPGPEPNTLEFVMAVEKLKYNKSTGIDQIPAELIKGGGRITRCEIYTLIISIWNR